MPLNKNLSHETITNSDEDTSPDQHTVGPKLHARNLTITS